MLPLHLSGRILTCRSQLGCHFLLGASSKSLQPLNFPSIALITYCIPTTLECVCHLPVGKDHAAVLVPSHPQYLETHGEHPIQTYDVN